MENTVRCNNCNWEGVEEELQIFQEETDADSIDRSFFKGCTNCETDDYLMDL
jgi:Pyruvate/2-oxoacid:ferredoxin oxidoreductase delta subunit